MGLDAARPAEPLLAGRSRRPHPLLPVRGDRVRRALRTTASRPRDPVSRPARRPRRPTAILRGRSSSPAAIRRASLLAAEYARQTGQRMIVLRRSSGAGSCGCSSQRARVHVAGVHLSAAGEPPRQRRCRRPRDRPARRCCCGWPSGKRDRRSPRSQRVASIRGLLRKRLRWVGREPGSGARQCLDELLPPHTKPSRIAFDHRAVATALSSGWADAGVCVRLVSEEAGLRFLSVRTENYDLSFLKSSQTDPRVEALVRVVRSPAYRLASTFLERVTRLQRLPMPAASKRRRERMKAEG